MYVLKHLNRFCTILVLVLAGGMSHAASVGQVGTSRPGMDVIVSLDVSTPNLAYFDLVLTPPADMLLRFALDDSSDGAGAAYTRATAFVTDGSGNRRIAFFGTTFLGGIDYAGTAAESGFRVQGLSGQFERFFLRFATSPTISVGTHPLTMFLTQGIDDGTSQSEVTSKIDFNTTIAPIPLPAGGLLVLTGLGALALVRRRHRQPA